MDPSQGIVLTFKIHVLGLKVQEAFKKSKQFFDLPKSTKLKYGKSDLKVSFHGYYQSMYDFDHSIVCREIFDVWGNGGSYPETEVPGLEKSLTELKSDLNGLAHTLLRLTAMGLDLEDPEYFVNCHQGILNKADSSATQTNFRTIIYPPMNETEFIDLLQGCDGVMLNRHTDYGTMTLLFQDSLGGLEVRFHLIFLNGTPYSLHTKCAFPDVTLQVLKNGVWTPVPPIPNSILVNTGDLMEIWSSGRIPATVRYKLLKIITNS